MEAPRRLSFVIQPTIRYNYVFLQKEAQTKANARAILQAFALPQKGLKKIMDEAKEQARSEFNSFTIYTSS